MRFNVIHADKNSVKDECNCRRSKGGHVWAYGVTTVPSRIDTTLPRTLDSLAAAGFIQPQVFLDGAVYGEGFGPSNTLRFNRAGAYGNWLLSLAELWIMYPKADRYALFEDDIQICQNTLRYLDRIELADNHFWNLYSAPKQERHIKDTSPKCFIPATEDHFRGALAVVFPRQAVLKILTTLETWEAPSRASYNLSKRDSILHRVTSILKLKEHYHNPSLVQHTGETSTLIERDNGLSYQDSLSQTFPGPDFDALTLLKNIPT